MISFIDRHKQTNSCFMYNIMKGGVTALREKSTMFDKMTERFGGGGIQGSWSFPCTSIHAMLCIGDSNVARLLFDIRDLRSKQRN